MSVLVLGIVIGLTAPAFAGSSTRPENSSELEFSDRVSCSCRGAVYVEALGRGGAGGLGGEVAIRKRVAVGATVGFMPADGERVTTFSPYVHLVLVARGAHAWFADAGPAVTHRSIPSPVPEWDGVSETSVGAIATSGYELSGERLFFRSSISVAVGPGGVAPWGGVALGVRF